MSEKLFIAQFVFIHSKPSKNSSFETKQKLKISANKLNEIGKGCWNEWKILIESFLFKLRKMWFIEVLAEICDQQKTFSSE